jgi:hypothetical protein
VQALAEAEALHQFWKYIKWRLPTVWSQVFLRKAAPFGDDSGAEGGGHHKYLATDAVLSNAEA